MKIWILAIFILMILASFFWIYREGVKEGEKTQIIKQQEQQIEIQNEVITEQKKVFKRKVINRSFSTNDNFEWLRQNICQDC